MDKLELGKQLLEQVPSNWLILVPTREYVQNLKIGNNAPSCFNRMAEVKEIFGQGDDIHGKAYVCYFVKFSENSTISHSIKEGELVRTVQLCNKFKSFELDAIEAYLISRKG